jgi:periplasmic copper chaperone A
MIRGAALAALVVASACGGDDGDAPGAVVVTDAWARSTPAGTTVGAVYFTVEGGDSDALVGASVDPAVAGAVELHMTMLAGDPTMTTGVASGEATMHPVPEIALPVALEPGSWHLMLVGLADPLQAGETFDLTLDFAVAADQVVTVDVRDQAP